MSISTSYDIWLCLSDPAFSDPPLLSPPFSDTAQPAGRRPGKTSLTFTLSNQDWSKCCTQSPFQGRSSNYFVVTAPYLDVQQSATVCVINMHVYWNQLNWFQYTWLPQQYVQCSSMVQCSAVCHITMLSFPENIPSNGVGKVIEEEAAGWPEKGTR